MPLIAPAAALPAVYVAPWAKAFAVYAFARRRHEVFLQDVLDPASAKATAAGRPMTPYILELEDCGNDLCAARQEALRDCVKVPAANTEELRLKFRIAYEEVLKFADSEGLTAAILFDVERLLCQLLDCIERGGISFTFERRNIRPVQPGQIGQRLLRKLPLAAQAPQIFGKDLA